MMAPPAFRKKTKKWLKTLKPPFKVASYSSHSPSRSSSASSGYKPRSAPLDPPDREQKRQTWALVCVCCWGEDVWGRVLPLGAHKTLVLLLDGGSTPQSVDAVYGHSQAELWLRLPALQPQLLHHGRDHVAAALHTIDALQQRRTGTTMSLEVRHFSTKFPTVSVLSFNLERKAESDINTLSFYNKNNNNIVFTERETETQRRGGLKEKTHRFLFSKTNFI